jgi:hypothetical protein
MKPILYIIFLLIAVSSLGQERKSEEGFIVTNNMDTIYGKIKKKPNTIVGEFIKIIFIDKNNLQSKYSAYDLISFKKGTITYESVLIGEYKSFAELRIDGYLKLYYRSESGSRGKPGKVIRPYLRKTNSDKFKIVLNINFEKQMTEYFSDYKDLSDAIDKRTLKIKDLELIVNTYNTWIKRKL